MRTYQDNVDPVPVLDLRLYTSVWKSGNPYQMWDANHERFIHGISEIEFDLSETVYVVTHKDGLRHVDNHFKCPIEACEKWVVDYPDECPHCQAEFDW
jgi:hypothetical protein